MPRKRLTDPWPWPADSPIDRRERLARIYREALLRVDPDECYRLDADAARVGATWIAPKRAIYEPDDQLTAELLADDQRVQPRTIDAWVADGMRVIHSRDGSRYRYGDVLDYLADRRRRRAAAAAPVVAGER